MRYTREYYSLRFDETESMTDFLTRVKSLEERIDATKITLDKTKRTLLCLSMALPSEYRPLTQIWEVTPGITAEKAMTMLLEAERRNKKDNKESLGIKILIARGRNAKSKSSEHSEKKCYGCNKPGYIKKNC